MSFQKRKQWEGMFEDGIIVEGRLISDDSSDDSSDDGNDDNDDDCGVNGKNDDYNDDLC